MKLTPKRSDRISLGLALALCGAYGCASGGRFGDFAAEGAGETPECIENSDCWDGEPSTEDTCSSSGECVFLSSVKPDAEKDNEEIDNDCHAISEVSGDAEIDVEVQHIVVEAVHTVPLEYGNLYRISVTAQSRLEVLLQDDALEGVMFVLLDGCANACRTRIAFGAELCTEVLEPGTYILAVFSSRAAKFTFTADFLEPSDSCNGLDTHIDC